MQSTLQPVIMIIVGLAGFLFWFFNIRMIIRHKKEKKQLQTEISVIKHSTAEMPYKISSNNGWWGVTNNGIVADNAFIPFAEISFVTMNYPKRWIHCSVKSGTEYRSGNLRFEYQDFDTVAQAYLFMVQHTGNNDQFNRAKREIALYQGQEIRMKCRVCGHVFCYNYRDVQRNENLKKNAAWESVGAVLDTLAVSTLEGAVRSGNADRIESQIKDWSRCPNCNSTDLMEVSAEEYKQALIAESNAATPFAPSASAGASNTEEIRHFKELLDEGIITQEEFDAKKKQLLGL